MIDTEGDENISYTRLINISNKLGNLVCSYYYHLFGEKLEAAQILTSESSRKMPVKYRNKAKGEIDCCKTVDALKKELTDILTYAGLDPDDYEQIHSLYEKGYIYLMT